MSIMNVFDVSNLNDLLEGREEKRATELANDFTDYLDVTVTTDVMNTLERKEGLIVPADLFDCVPITKVANNSANICQPCADDITKVANESAHACQLIGDDFTDKIDVFGDEEVYICGEVGCWKESAWDSQMVNAREFRRDDRRVEAIKSSTEEAEAHQRKQSENNVESPGVPEEYDRQTEPIYGSITHPDDPTKTAEMRAFGHILQYPTKRRPIDYHRVLMSSATGIPTWFEASGVKRGDQLTAQQKEEAKKLLYTWKDLFASGIEEMPVTDLVVHRIPVYPGVAPKRTKDRIYTREEINWMVKKIPEMERAGVIGRSESPWSHQTKFVRKKDGGLRMVHVFCPINQATILSSYPMKRIEPVVNNLMRSAFSTYFQADAANSFWAVPMYPPHAYRTAFSTPDGQWQYLRMGQGLAGAPQTYTRLKDIFSGYIPAPDPEACLNKCSAGAFECFVDDDFGAFPSFRS